MFLGSALKIILQNNITWRLIFRRDCSRHKMEFLYTHCPLNTTFGTLTSDRHIQLVKQLT